MEKIETIMIYERSNEKNATTGHAIYRMQV
jgi:hypothetical protein